MPSAGSDRLVPDAAFVLNLQAQCVEIDDGVHGFERALLLLFDLGQHFVCDGGESTQADLQSVQLLQMALDFRTLMPRAYMLITWSSKPGRRR